MQIAPYSLITANPTRVIKILSAEQIREADRYTIEHESISSIDLMERAALAFAELFIKKYSPEHAIYIFCGYGNNGGDGLAIARILLKKNYPVLVYILAENNKYSNDFLVNQSRLQKINDQVIHFITEADDFPVINGNSLIIDALFGSGLNRSLSGIAEKLVSYLNIQEAVRVGVDIPSGLFPDRVREGAVFLAHHTLTFLQPKLAFLFPESNEVVGEWEAIDIGLNKKFIQSLPCTHFLSEKSDMETILHSRGKFAHKGGFGHAFINAGNHGKMGAAILCAGACMRSGAGLTTVYVPEGTAGTLNAAIPEAMTLTYSTKIKSRDSFSSAAFGPGIGTDTYSTAAFLRLLKKIKVPAVFDADALNIISAQKKGLKLLPKNAIITPHLKEFERLAGKTKNWYKRHKRQSELSQVHSIFIVLKGAFTCITTPDGLSYFNPTGNPAMAKGGSGDVLTGIIAGLLAQKYSSLQAALLGVYLHGLSGDLAVKKQSVHSLLASDIIATIGDAFRELGSEKL
ncbi:MAG: NAD(P)H-hydrate dehydratase [Chitinophagales bacterium]